MVVHPCTARQWPPQNLVLGQEPASPEALRRVGDRDREINRHQIIVID
jgi:hypothetical protein